MSMTTNKQALRQTAEKAQEHGVFNMEIHSETLLALLDELEAAESLAKQQGHIAVALFDEVTTLRRNADDKAPELRSQLEAAEKRIAELESQRQMAFMAGNRWADKFREAEKQIAELEAKGVADYANRRGFSFQHGSIHAHFGNGDVMVGSVTFENGDAGINFAPVREKIGGVGTDYEWTRGKTAEQVDSVFVIASSNAEGLEVIRDKLSDAIETLRAAGITTKGE